MRIGLIDIDYNGSFPNLALMKLSAYHKQKGDSVGWYLPFSDRYDIVYVAKVFSFSPDYSDCINADEIIYGGSGYQIKLINGEERWITPDKHNFMDKLPDEVEHIYPDYSIYPNLTKDTAYGYLTRGCPRNCSFCHVAQKEGTKSIKCGNLTDFWNGQKNICLLDPNILACKNWKQLLQELIDSKAHIDFTQGLDARLLTEEKCRLLAKIKIKNIHFAWDNYKDKDIILPKLKMFAKYRFIGKNKDHHAIVYTLVNFNTTFE